MTDRELLELAAKAARVFLTEKTMGEVFPGFEWDASDWPIFTDHGADGTVAWKGEDGKPAGTARKHWNPLTDDGDALRLAVKMGLVVYCDTDEAWCEWGDLDDDNEYTNRMSAEPEYNGPASVRRAIVRAAAAIGQSMEGKK